LVEGWGGERGGMDGAPPRGFHVVGFGFQNLGEN